MGGKTETKSSNTFFGLFHVVDDSGKESENGARHGNG